MVIGGVLLLAVITVCVRFLRTPDRYIVTKGDKDHD